MVPIETEAARLRLSGVSVTEIDCRVADGFKSGHFQAPARAGHLLTCYRRWLPDRRVWEGDAQGPPAARQVDGPNLTDTGIGGARGTPALITRSVRTA